MGGRTQHSTTYPNFVFLTDASLAKRNVKLRNVCSQIGLYELSRFCRQNLIMKQQMGRSYYQPSQLGSDPAAGNSTTVALLIAS